MLKESETLSISRYDITKEIFQIRILHKIRLRENEFQSILPKNLAINLSFFPSINHNPKLKTHKSNKNAFFEAPGAI